MKFAKAIAIAVIAASTGVGAFRAEAQIPETQPAEFPPASYKGKQYVDSAGCVFIRAGIDGNVSWVPRVSRSRSAICGFKPSLSGPVASAAAPTPAAEPPVQITMNDAPVVEAAVPRPVAAQPKPVPRKVATAAPKRRPAPVVVRQTAPKPAPVVIAQAPAPLPPVNQIERSPGVLTACPGASLVAQSYLRGTSGLPVRCGPQDAPVSAGYLTAAVTGAQARPVSPDPADAITAQTRIVPLHVAKNRINTIDSVQVPHGYRTVWDDGRLNPHRAEQTLAGRERMLLVWTQTVPRRLINQATGRDVTAKVPLVYPFLDIVTQQRELGEVTIVRRDGKLAKRILRNTAAAPAAPATRKPVYSSRSAPQAKQPQAAPATPRAATPAAGYVQVGSYRNPANAQAAVQKLARLGMPARVGKIRQGSGALMMVQAGPIAGPSLGNALAKLRGAGYRDAFVRR